MSLSELTDPGAVRSAMVEFDAIGREAFLARYGFRPAKAYFLNYGSRRYDSKAIAGVAFSLQHPDRPPLRGKDFSGGEATVRKKLRALGFEVERDPTIPKRTKNPDWTREETILAFDLYLRRRPQLPGQTDRDVVELSDLLRRWAAQRRVVGNEAFRNPEGVSMKIANLSHHEPGSTRVGLKNGSGTEPRIWDEFRADLTQVHLAAKAIRTQIEGAVPPASAPELSRGILEDPAVSRGPRPTFGQIVQVRTDGEASVYVMQLHGRVAELFPQRDLQGQVVLKFGRSNDVARRAIELNCGFPPGLDLSWKPIVAETFPSGGQAHDVEQAMLSILKHRRFAIGGEFAIVPERELAGVLRAALGERPRPAH